MTLTQNPLSGSRQIRYTGDILAISLRPEAPVQGKAFLRTNYGSLRRWREDYVRSVEENRPFLDRAWRDLPMVLQEDGSFQINLPLSEPGRYSFKAYLLLPDGTREWVPGENATVKVEPACTAGYNTIYNAFLRQFGPNCAKESTDEEDCRAMARLDQKGFTVIPPSGKFSDFEHRLDFVMDTLGFRIILFLPIHPTPTGFARMGRFGSPFAPIDFFTVDSSMADFDHKTTPLEQFCRLVKQIHARNGMAMIDLPLDHTGWASTMQVHHPEWFLRNPDGTFENPGAWGVVWADLCKLDFHNHALWQRLADVLLHWCRLGVDGFRCDAGYMIPLPVWKYLSAKIRIQFPNTIFLLEGLGGPWQTTCELLEDGGLDWAYSESFQIFGAEAEGRYLGKSLAASSQQGLLVNFAETHDNTRLADKSPEWARLRLTSAALLAPAGAFGMANGVEWLATERIDVHEARSLNWGAARNLIAPIAALNRLLRLHPAFYGGAELWQPKSLRGNVVGLCRFKDNSPLMILVNPSVETPAAASWDSVEFDVGERPWDLLLERPIHAEIYHGRVEVDLPPGIVLCLVPEKATKSLPAEAPIEGQLRREAVLHLLQALPTDYYPTQEETDRWACLLSTSPEAFLASLGKSVKLPSLVPWHPAVDCRRTVPLRRGDWLLLEDSVPFEVDCLQQGNVLERNRSLSTRDGRHFAFVCCSSMLSAGISFCQLQATRFPSNAVPVVCRGDLLILEDATVPKVNLVKNTGELDPMQCGLCSNIHGSYTLVRAIWGRIDSKYDAFMAVNFNRYIPEERYAVIPGFRAWLRFMDFSYELGPDCQTAFKASYDNVLQWTFQIPSTLGMDMELELTWKLAKNNNSACLSFWLKRDSALKGEQIQLILRPILDYRSHHAVTKAYAGPEKDFPKAVKQTRTGCLFQMPSQRRLLLESEEASFHSAPEWFYSNPLPIEQERSLDDSTDLFTPGYFLFDMKNISKASMTATAYTEGEAIPQAPATEISIQTEYSLEEALRRSMDFFVVQRDQHQSVIAGYPWFLDWGRDTLICLRGLIAAGKFKTATDIICQFAQFEAHGTLPNMIRGNDTSDRDTSDAPLWLFVATEDFLKANPSSNLLTKDCGGRELIAILLSLADSLWQGAPNGVRVDKESALLFSPAHFTWMDTNYPAGTPRCGYPVEIQALWIHAMQFLASHGHEKPWAERAAMARKNLLHFFALGQGRGLSDCLHAEYFAPAHLAEKDDACRPNQLLAILLGAIPDVEIQKSILDSCWSLLIPAGIRSLADQSVGYPQPVYRDGVLLNNPSAPYWHSYTGDEDTHRKPAYHNGTAWAWQMPLFSEAFASVYPDSQGLATALSLLVSARNAMQEGCLGFLSEIYDGDAPHTPKGCPAQAWSVTEFYRVLHKLTALHQNMPDSNSMDNGNCSEGVSIRTTNAH